MELASSANNSMIQQQAMQYKQTGQQPNQASASPTQANTPQISLEAAPAQTNPSPAYNDTRIGGSIDTYA